VVWRYRYTACDSSTTVDWTHTYTIDYAGALTPPALGTSTVACPADATDPGAPADITDACGRTVSAVLIGQDAATPGCEGTVVWRYRYTACDSSTTVDWTHTYTIDLPSPIVPANGSSNVQCLADAVQVAAPLVTDACGNNLTPVITENVDPVPACGANKIYTYTYTDCANNVSVYTYTYTIDDTTDPTAIPPTATALQCAGDIPAAITTITAFNNLIGANASDNCTATSNLTVSSTTGSLVGQSYNGTINRTYTITDACGNETDVDHVFNINDTTPPTAVCQPITVQLVNGMANIDASEINNGSNDNCGVPRLISVSPSSFNCSNVGANTVTLVVEDDAGLQNSCTTTVTVEDNEAPSTVCIASSSLTITLDPVTGTASITPDQIDNGSSDECGIASMSVSPNVFDCTDVGNNTVTLTVIDNNGNPNSCSTTIIVDPPTISTGAITGTVVNPIPDNPEPASDLVEVTACPGGTLVPRDVELTLDLTGSNIDASNISTWQISTNQGVSWTDVAGTSGQTTVTIMGLTTTTIVRAYILSGSCPSISPYALIRFLPPDEPPIIESITSTTICLGDDVDIVASSFFEYGGQFGGGGYFNYANPDNWLVDGVEFFPAPGNNTNPSNWFETNGPRIFGGIRYDTSDNTKFAVANGIGFSTTMETPIFSTIGMSASEAILEFYQAYYFCDGAFGEIKLSTDGGENYDITLNTDQNDNLTSGNDSGFSVLATSGGCGNGPQGQHPTSDPFQPASIDLSDYLNEPSLRIMFIFDSTLSTSTCNANFAPGATNTCGNIPSNFDVYSTWVVDDVGFPYAPIDEILQWRDEFGNVIATGSNVTLTPIVPGERRFNVTALVNGCRADTDDGTEFVDVSTSLAYAGEDFTPASGKCGQSSIQLNAYDNTISAYNNSLTFDEYGNAAYPRPGSGDVVPTQHYTLNDPNDMGSVFDYMGTGVTGTWSVVSASTTACGATATFSSNTDPRATFTAEPGDYTLRWTLNDANACWDEVDVTITNCSTIDFDGSDDYITFKNNYNLNGSFSIEVWIKPESTTGTIFSRKDINVPNAGYDLTLAGGNLSFNFGSGSISTGNIIDTSRYYHIAVTFDGSEYIIYVDGVPIGSPVSGSAPATTPNNIEAILGAMDQSPPGIPMNYFSGWMDEFRVWNRALNVQHIRQMMNQEIMALGTDVGGEVIPTRIYGVDTNQDGTEEDLLIWADLEGYYRMDAACGYLTAIKGVTGRLRNINSSQNEWAPIPYTTSSDNDWDNSNTWTHGDYWYIPGSTQHSTSIDWNIVRTSNTVTMDHQDMTLLGLLVDSNELTITNTGGQNEMNPGHGLWITDYLKLDGFIDLVGESQLVQKRYNTTGNPTIQFNESILDVTSSGYLERDQQGGINKFNYNYWSLPIGAINTSSNNMPATLSNNKKDGTTSSSPAPITWIGGYDASAPNPVSIPEYWLWAYENYPTNVYGNWVKLYKTSGIKAGLGYTMKGSGNTSYSYQNYVFTGKPNNNTITRAITLNNDALVGNPYPSALDANEFILDNIPGGNQGTTGSIDGTLYFWIHFDSNNTHVLRDYQGGYATYNLSGGLAPVTGLNYTTTDGFYISGAGNTNLRPGQYMPVAQGFFVHSAFAGDKDENFLKFQNSQRIFKRETNDNAADGSQFLKSSNSKSAKNSSDSTIDETSIKRIRFQFKSAEGTNRSLLLAFTPNNEASDGFDYGYDAKVFETIPSDMLFMINNEKYTIQGVGAFDENKQYPFGIFSKDGGVIEISITEMENLDPNTKVYIYDSLLETYTKINDKNSKYETTVEAGNHLNRFYITFIKKNKTLSSNVNEFDQFDIKYLNDTKEINIKAANYVEIKQVYLINTLGQTIKAWNKTNVPTMSNEMTIPLTKNIAEGSYIIKVVSSIGIVNEKIIVSQ
ncbi:HYR-like domain-containing protein, partial [Flavisericum labens]|uniref:HYR-like domain-containing protein n=1 Tax=Flavisericum labens TaxID=3377112 RepID=UPI00387A89F9